MGPLSKKPRNNEKIMLKINNLCIMGRFKHNLPKDVIEWKCKIILLYDNKIVLKKQSLSITLTQNIQKILQKGNLKQLIKKRLEYEFKTRIFDIKLRIGNIHKNITVPCTARQITEEFLPGLKEITPIETSKFPRNRTRLSHLI